VRDFTLTKYESLLQTIKKTNYLTCTVYDFLKNNPGKCIILRHDVDRAVNRNLAMAKLEHSYGIKSTYYFRHIEETFKPEIILQMAKMEHEIGFHYEVIDKANGDIDKAIEIFRKELEDLRKVTEKVTEINTVCMHGNPLKPWSNRDLWQKYDFRSFGLTGEPYISIDYNKVFYLTDTGRTWADLKIRVKDTIDRSENKAGANSKTDPTAISSTDDVIHLIQSEKVSQICLLVHPNRWCEDLGGWAKELLLQNVKNVGKAGIVWYRSKCNVSSEPQHD
jgi:adenine-specific DNA methylase